MSDSSAICTLFEGDYHYGLGALVNSALRCGYRGNVLAGCRGPLPPWAQHARECGAYRELQVDDALTIRFIPLETGVHLTNYKPRFMLDLLNTLAPEVDRLFYLDPDITIKGEWAFFEEWVRSGVALCEDFNSPWNPTHPLRLRWREFFAPHGVMLNSDHSLFVNGGFVGLTRQNQAFLGEWLRNLELIRPHADELRRLYLGERTLLFQVPDQDALNVTLYSTHSPVSVLGREGMDFIPGGYTMSHAAGDEKPWRKRLFARALGGYPPSFADKGYWQNAEHPIRLYSPIQLRKKRFELRAAAAVGRMVRRS